MQLLYDEILRRFPELRNKVAEGEEALPYVLISRIVEWLHTYEKALHPETIRRIRDFKKWCEDQPRGATAANDVYTIFVVGFYENLFAHEQTQKIVPYLVSKEDLEQSADYLISWVGKENYEKTKQLFN